MILVEERLAGWPAGQTVGQTDGRTDGQTTGFKRVRNIYTQELLVLKNILEVPISCLVQVRAAQQICQRSWFYIYYIMLTFLIIYLL